jgi:hypothetical protein
MRKLSFLPARLVHSTSEGLVARAETVVIEAGPPVPETDGILCASSKADGHKSRNRCTQ